MHDPDEKLTDIQYGILCGLTVETIAARTQSTPTKIREELSATLIPPWAAQLARAQGGR